MSLIRDKESKVLLAIIFCLIFIGGFFALPKMAMAGVAYSPSDNKITVTGYSEAMPCNFTDIYNADKAGTLSLHARTGITGTDGSAVATDRAERPADYVVLGGASNDLYITVANWNATTATIRITGTDRAGNAQTEDIVVNANGNFYTTKLFKTITHTQVIAFTGTSFDYDLTQGQWGVMWKQSDTQFYLVSHLYISSGYFKDTAKDFKMDVTSNTYFQMGSSAHIQFGDKDGNGNVYNGCKIEILNSNGYIFDNGGAGAKLYDSYFNVHDAVRISLTSNGPHEIIGCIFDNAQIIRIYGSNSVVKDVWMHRGTMYGFNPGSISEINNVIVSKRPYGIYIVDASSGITFKNVVTRNITSKDIMLYPNCSGNVYVIDCTLANWNFNWGSNVTATVWRQNTFNLKVTDKDGNNIDGASVKIWDKDDNLVVDTTTSSGVIAEQTITRGYYNKANGDTLQDKSPHTIEIKKAGYQTYTEKFTLDKKIDWTIRLKPAPDGMVKVFGTEYASGENGSVYVETLTQNGTPVNDATVTFTLYDRDGNVVPGYQDLGMTYITGSNGKYRPTLSFSAPSAEGVYVIDAIAQWTVGADTYYAYGSGEIHVSQTANLTANIKESLIGFTGTADSGSTTTLIDDALTQDDNFWNGMTLVITAGTNAGEIRQIEDFDAASDTITVKTSFTSAIDNTSQYLIRREMNWAERIWSWNTRSLTAFGNLAADIWNTTYSGVRKLTSRQIGDEISEHIAQEENVASNVWGESQTGYTATGTFGYYLNSRISAVASDVWNYTSGIGSTLIQNLGDVIWNSYSGVRKLTSRQVGTNEYIAGVSSSSTVSQVADQQTQENVEYNVGLVRKATFDFAGIADGGSTTILVDSELDQPDDHWNNYELWIMSGNNIGLKRAICDFDKASHTITLCGDALSQPIEVGDQYVISHERKLVHAIWNWSSRQLTSAANIAGDIWEHTGGRTLSSATNIAADIWNATTRKLTSRYTDEASPVDLAQVADVSSLATSAELSQTKTDIVAEIDANEAKIDNIYTDTQYIRSKVDNILTKWGAYSASDIMGDLNTVKSRIGTSTDSSSDETLFGGTKFIQEKWGTQTAQTIFDKASSTLALVNDIQTELGYNGTSTTAYTDLQLVKSYTDALEGYIGTPSDDSSVDTLFGKIKDVREKLDQLDTLETKLDTVDSIVDAIRTSQQLNYTVELSDVGEVLQGNTYRAKLSIWDYENNPADASTIPTIIIYDSSRATVTSSSMTATSIGVYEFTYSIPSDATSGLWESVVSVDLGGSSVLTLNDYWEVEGSPAKVIINSINDLTVPSISANVTISNEGNSGYEYQYEWCVVTSQENQCGGEDDVNYVSAAKYLDVGEDYTANLNVTVPNTGNYWFKVVVYYGTEASGASRTFTAVEEEEKEVVSGGGKSALPTVTLANTYNKLLEIQNEMGYHGTGRTAYKDLANTRYSLGVLPNQLSDPLYSVLTGISSDIQTISGDTAYRLNDIYEVLEANSTDLKYIANKSAELRAMTQVNKSLISKATNKPIIQTWFTEGSIILNIMVVNPPDAARTAEIKEYLPKEVKPEHIIRMEEGLELKYDSSLDNYYVTGKVKLGPGERKIFKIEAEDIFTISEEELSSLAKQTETLMEPLKGTAYFAQASILKSEIDANLETIRRTQIEGSANIDRKISAFRNNRKDLQKVKANIEALKKIVSEASGKGEMFGSLFGVSTTMTWVIIIIVIAGIAVLMVLLYAILAKNRALEYHISGGKRLKAPPIVDVKKHATRIKGGLITYFLPPFGKPITDLKQMIKIINILIIIGILVMLILLRFHFFKLKNNVAQNNSNSQEAILNPGYTAEETKFIAEPNQETAAKLKKLKIIETGIGWLNVRSKPSTTNSKILDTVDVGEEFNYTDQQNGWYKIIFDDDGETEGWVFGKYIEEIQN